MKINIQEGLKKLLFYNNICLIVCIFCAVCFFTSNFLIHSYQKQKVYEIQQNGLIGPIEVTNKSVIYKINVYFSGRLSSKYISGEVLDENEDTLYEFGKDLWHEEGYDSDGHWSESERRMKVYLTFSEKGKYYLKFYTDKMNMDNITITISRLVASYIPHLGIGMIFFIFLLIIWLKMNKEWIKPKIDIINDKLMDMLEE